MVDVRSAPIEIGVGSELGSYRLEALLGEGAMGKVWRACHVRLGREVAIKVLNPEYVARPDVVQRFFREARVVNDIDHEHIVEVTDFVEAPGIAYLVMELLEGTSLRELMKGRRRKWPPLARGLEIMAQVCDALEAAHQKGVVHRDLKPDNVFVVKRGGEDFAKVLDFGVAKLRDVSDDHAATHTGMILGTPLYMSPEQALGRDVDRAADVWSAGVVLYELLSGTAPFQAESFVELATLLRDEPPKPLPARTPRGERVPQTLSYVVMRCLEKQPSDRIRSMAALAEALRAPGFARPPRRAPLVLATVAVAAAVAVAGLAIARGVPARIAAAIRSGWRSAGEVASRVETQLPAATAPAPLPAAPPAAAPSPRPSPPLRGGEGDNPPPRAAPSLAQIPRPPERAHPAPKPPPPVELRVRSTPAGATIVRLDTGERLGRTPSRVKVPRKAAVVWIRMSLDGYEPVKFAVDLRKDNAASVSLHRVPRKASRRR